MLLCFAFLGSYDVKATNTVQDKHNLEAFAYPVWSMCWITWRHTSWHDYASAA